MEASTDKFYKLWIVTGLLFLVTLLHGLLYFLVSHDQIDINVRILVVSFWLSILLLSASFVWIKKETKLIIVSSSICILILIPTAESCLAWTAWSINGFGP